MEGREDVPIDPERHQGHIRAGPRRAQRAGDLPLLPRFPRRPVPPPRALALDARFPGPRPFHFPHLENSHGDRDSPGSDDRRGVLHRSRHGGGDRGDVGDRPQRHPLPRRHPGRDELEQGEAAPHPRGQRDRRDGGGDPRCDSYRARLQDRLRVGGEQGGAAQLDGRRDPGARRLSRRERLQ